MKGAYRVNYVKKVGNAEVGQSTLINTSNKKPVAANFHAHHKNCRILSIKAV